MSERDKEMKRARPAGGSAKPNDQATERRDRTQADPNRRSQLCSPGGERGEDRSPADPTEIEREKDILVQLAARAGARRPDALALDDEEFLAWLARDLRDRERASDAWPDDKVASIADRILAQASARTFSVLDGGARPTMRTPAVGGSVSQVLASAAAAGFAPVLDPAVAAGTGRDLWDEECEDWAELPPGIPPGQYVALGVSGDSMTPLLHSGDMILVRLGPIVVRETVVVARLPEDGYVVKRAGQVTGARVELYSLNPAYPPINLLRAKGAIVGTVVLRWCAHLTRAKRRR